MNFNPVKCSRILAIAFAFVSSIGCDSSTQVNTRSPSEERQTTHVSEWDLLQGAVTTTSPAAKPTPRPTFVGGACGGMALNFFHICTQKNASKPKTSCCRFTETCDEESGTFKTPCSKPFDIACPDGSLCCSPLPKPGTNPPSGGSVCMNIDSKYQCQVGDFKSCNTDKNEFKCGDNKPTLCCDLKVSDCMVIKKVGQCVRRK